MVTIGHLRTPATGRGLFLFGGTFSITGTGGVAVVGGNSVLTAQATVTNAATTVPTDSASISSYTGSTVNVVVIQHAAAANSIEGSAKNVDVWAMIAST